MPNWIEGTMKLRGKREDIRRFFNEGVCESAGGDKEKQIKDISSIEGILEFQFEDCPYIDGTRRMFITDERAEMAGDEGICVFNIKQAWSFSSTEDDLRTLQNIANRFHLDIRLYGVECGVEFTQEVIVRHCDDDGKNGSVINHVTNYSDWEWDCPFPHMGG